MTDERQGSFVVLCDARGNVTRVLRNSLKPKTAINAGMPWAALFEAAQEPEARGLLERAHADLCVVDQPLQLAGETGPLQFVATRLGGDVLCAAAPTLEAAVNDLLAELLDPASAARRALMVDPLMLGLEQVDVYDELTRLNNELVGMQRELAQRNDELARANAALQHEMDEHQRAEAERRRLQARLQRGEKLESLSALAGGVAHDFNNLLMGILGYAQFALEELPEGSPTRGRVERIEESARRATELTRKMLAYSGKGAFLREALDLRQVVEGTWQVLESAVPPKVELVWEPADDLPHVEADAMQLRQVVTHLVTNAAEAIGTDAGTVTVRLSSWEASHEDVTANAFDDDLPGGTYLALEVVDTGVGIEPAVLGRIFDPFCSTKFVGRGLGLSVVQGIVRGHHGTLQVVSTPGVGSTFRVLLPAVPATLSSESPAPLAAGASPADAGTTILVADDDDGVRSVVTATLRRAGYYVLTATDGRETLAVFEQHRGTVSAIVLDLTMPNMDGVAVVRQLRENGDDVPVIMCSGYSAADVGGRLARLGGVIGVLQKPYSPAGLLSCLNEYLGEMAARGG